VDYFVRLSMASYTPLHHFLSNGFQCWNRWFLIIMLISAYFCQSIAVELKQPNPEFGI
jgi:hypothetical protein